MVAYVEANQMVPKRIDIFNIWWVPIPALRKNFPGMSTIYQLIPAPFLSLFHHREDDSYNYIIYNLLSTHSFLSLYLYILENVQNGH